MFVSPGEMLYEGMVIGENAKPQDLEVNRLNQAAHQLPRQRQGRRHPPHTAAAHDLEQAIAYIQDDELVEVTPKAVRIRKRF